MPFTFSHPASILPLKYLPKKYYSLTGLVIGSIVPDFEYFIKMKDIDAYSHTLGGLFFFDIPVSFCIAFIFHTIVRDTLIRNLPGSLQSRFLVYKKFNWNKAMKKNWIIITLSFFTGAVLHFAWDSLTHDTGYLFQAIPPFLTAIKINGVLFEPCNILQYFSSFLGMAINVIVLLKLPKSKEMAQKTSITYWAIIVTITTIVIMLQVMAGLRYKDFGDLSTVVVNVISAGLIALLFASILSLLIKKPTAGIIG